MNDPPAKDSRNWAIAAHLSGVFAGYVVPLGWVLAPLVIWLVKKEDDRFVAHHALETLNFQITIALLALLGVVLTLTVVLAVVGIPLMLAAGILSLVYGILGAIGASEGRWFEYPGWVLRLVRSS